ncbi:MAG TPA: porin, partial [Pirellulales bacterium]
MRHWIWSVLIACAAMAALARDAGAQQPAAERLPDAALVAQAERLPAADDAGDSDDQATGSSTDDRLRDLELRLEEQRAISEGMRLDFERRLATPPPPPERPPYVVGTVLGMVPIWNNGLEFRSLNKDYYFHIGGRTQLDFVDLSSPNPTDALINTQQRPNDGLQQAVDMRRGRLRAEGSMYEFSEWCVEYNFVNNAVVQAPNTTAPQLPNGNYPNNGTSIRTLEAQVVNVPSPTDLWWNFRKLPILGNVTIGNQKEPFSLERLESSRYLDFMERNYGQDAFISPNANGFAPGIQTWNNTPDRRTTYALGVFKYVTNAYVFDVGTGEWEVAGRMTRALIYDESSEGRYLLHVGIGATQRGCNDQQIRYFSRGMLWNGPGSIIPLYADTNFMNAHYQDIVVPEMMFQYGSLFIQSEFQANWTRGASTISGSYTNPTLPVGANLGTLFFYSYYVQVGYFLTGESKAYDYQKGLVGRIIPYENAFATRTPKGNIFGSGAWQVLGRFQQLDLNSKEMTGGRLTDFTFGLNWFLNPNMKIQFNYDLMFRDAGAAPNGGPADAGTHGIVNGLGM